MKKTRRPLDRIDWLLLAAIAALTGLLLVELAEPAVAAWRNRPRPGAQVCRQYADAAAPVSYLLYLPRDYAKDSRWPLVVFLHGAGERGDDLEMVRKVGLPKQIEQGDASPVAATVLNDFVLVSPQCPRDSGWNAELVLGLIEDICSTFSVDRDRVCLTGHSMGAFAAWEIACQDPDRFAAIAPLCGGGTVERAEQLKNVPVWAFHGANDKVVPLGASRSMVEAVKKCGGRAELTVYPDKGHGILDVTYENPRLYEWLLSQRRGRTQRTSAPVRPAR